MGRFWRELSAGSLASATKQKLMDKCAVNTEPKHKFNLNLLLDNILQGLISGYKYYFSISYFSLL